MLMTHYGTYAGITNVTLRGRYFIAVFTFHWDVFIEQLGSLFWRQYRTHEDWFNVVPRGQLVQYKPLKRTKIQLIKLINFLPKDHFIFD